MLVHQRVCQLVGITRRPKARIWQWYSLATEVAAGARACQPTGPEDRRVAKVAPRAPLEPKGFQSPWELAEIFQGMFSPIDLGVQGRYQKAR